MSISTPIPNPSRRYKMIYVDATISIWMDDNTHNANINENYYNYIIITLKGIMKFDWLSTDRLTCDIQSISRRFKITFLYTIYIAIR